MIIRKMYTGKCLLFEWGINNRNSAKHVIQFFVVA